MDVLLFSDNLGAFAGVLDEPPAQYQLLFVPTAANAEGLDPFAQRNALAELGFQIDDLDLDLASQARVVQAVAAADIVYLGGGNTYYLLDRINRSGLRSALETTTPMLFSGGSAGAIVACPDISYIGDDMDSPSAAPDLESTTGLGLVDFHVWPHVDHPKFGATIEVLLANDPNGVALRDDQALLVRNGQKTTIESPAVL